MLYPGFSPHPAGKVWLQRLLLGEERRVAGELNAAQGMPAAAAEVQELSAGCKTAFGTDGAADRIRSDAAIRLAGKIEGRCGQPYIVFDDLEKGNSEVSVNCEVANQTAGIRAALQGPANVLADEILFAHTLPAEKG